jgi:hypothetical protein
MPSAFAASGCGMPRNGLTAAQSNLIGGRPRRFDDAAGLPAVSLAAAAASSGDEAIPSAPSCDPDLVRPNRSEKAKVRSDAFFFCFQSGKTLLEHRSRLAIIVKCRDLAGNGST